MPDFRIAEQARSEILDAFDYFEQQQEKLAKRLAGLIRDALHVIVEHPDRWPLIHRHFRRYRIDPFKYALIYEVLGDGSINVVAFWHLSRSERRLQRRLGDAS